MDNFDFIADTRFRALLERDFNELEICYENNASKSVLILSGSIIEAVLLEYLLHNLPSKKTEQELMDMNLFDLIKVADISKPSKDLSTVVKNYRNLIHPGREIRTHETFDEETAKVSFSLVKIIIKEIKEKYFKKYGYNAEDIYNKIKKDNSTYSIYDKLILKLNKHEQNRLVKLLLEDHIKEYLQNFRKNYIDYISPLKRLIESDALILYCKQLLSEIEKGKETRIFPLFEIFGDNLNILPEDERNLILTYVYNKLKLLQPIYKKVDDARFRALFLPLGLYFDTPFFKKYFLSLLGSLVIFFQKSDNWNYAIIYRNMVSCLIIEKRIECEEYIRNSYSEEVADYFFTNLVNDGNALPF